MICSRYSIDALIIPTSTCWVGPQPKVCSRDKIQYIWQPFHVPWPIKSSHLCSEYWGKRMKVSHGAYLAVSSHPVPRMTLKESPDPPASAFTFCLWQTVYSFWANSKSIFIRLLMSTHSVLWGFERLLQAYACDNTGWQSLPEELHNMPLIQERDHDITVTWDISSLAKSWLRSSEGQAGLWSSWFG